MSEQNAPKALAAIEADLGAYFQQDQAEPATDAPHDQETPTDGEQLAEPEADGEPEQQEAQPTDAGNVVDLDALDATAKFKLGGEEFTKDDIDYRRGRWNQKMTELDKKLKAVEARESKLGGVKDDDLDFLAQYRAAEKSDAGRLAHIEKLAEGLRPDVANWFREQVFPQLQKAGLHNRQQWELELTKRQRDELLERDKRQNELAQFVENNKKARPIVQKQLQDKGVKLSDSEWVSFFDWHEDRYLNGISVPVDDSYEIWASKRKAATKPAAKAPTKPQPTGQGKKPASKREDPYKIAKEIYATGFN